MQPKNKGVNQAPAVTQVTHVYKRVDGVEIKADVHRLDDRVVRPVVVWIHGGALMNGGRDRILRQMHQLVREGVVVVSIDYRLAPETKLPTKPPSRSSKSTSGCVSPDK